MVTGVLIGKLLLGIPNASVPWDTLIISVKPYYLKTSMYDENSETLVERYHKGQTLCSCEYTEKQRKQSAARLADCRAVFLTVKIENRIKKTEVFAVK